MKLIVASIPLFFILIGIEVAAAWILERRVYTFSDSFADLGCGMIEQLLGVLVKGSGWYVTDYARADAKESGLKEADSKAPDTKSSEPAVGTGKEASTPPSADSKSSTNSPPKEGAASAAPAPVSGASPSQ